jgi:hypothetical protein
MTQPICIEQLNSASQPFCCNLVNSWAFALALAMLVLLPSPITLAAAQRNPQVSSPALANPPAGAPSAPGVATTPAPTPPAAMPPSPPENSTQQVGSRPNQTVREVTTGGELQQAAKDGVAHIIITQHLNMVDVKPSVTIDDVQIKGNNVTFAPRAATRSVRVRCMPCCVIPNSKTCMKTDVYDQPAL